MPTKPDKPLLWLVRRPGLQGLQGASDLDRDWIERYPFSDDENLRVINCYLHQPVDPGLTRRFHAMINYLAKGIGEDFHALKNRLLAQAGSVESFTHVAGLDISVKAKGWSELEGPEAVEIFNRVVIIITTQEQYLPGMKPGELKDKVESYAGLRENVS